MLDGKSMNRLWPLIYVGFGLLSLNGGYESLRPERTDKTNADWVFIIIILILFCLFPLGAVSVGRAYGVETFRRPTFHRHPFGWWSDTLQPLRVSVVFSVLFSIGQLVAFPHTDAKGTMLFYSYLAMAVGLFLGERLVYVIFKSRIV
jgi:hypothetical protein